MAKQNLMETQSGGEGETLQAAPVAQATPEQFDVPIAPIDTTQQVDQTVVPTSVPDVQPAITDTSSQTAVVPQILPADITQQQPVEVAQPSPSFVDFSGDEPTVNGDALKPDNTILIQPDIDEPTTGFDYSFEIPDIPEEPLTATDISSQESAVSKEERDQEFEVDSDIDYSDFRMVDENQQTEEEAKPEPFDFSDPYKEIRDNTLNSATGAVQSTPYSDIDVQKYKETATNLSKSYINGYTSLIGIDKLATDVLYENNVGSDADALSELSDLTYDKSINENALASVQNAISKKDPSILKDKTFMENLDAVNFFSGDKVSINGQYDVAKLKEVELQLKSNLARNDREIQSLTQKRNTGAGLTAVDDYKSETKIQSKNLKKTLGSKYGDEYASLVDWMFNSKEYGYIITNSLEGKGEKYNPGDVLAYKLKSYPNLTESEKGSIYRLAGRAYQEKKNDVFSLTGQGDYLSYSGFTIEKKQLEKQDHQKLIKARDEVTKTVIPKYEKNVADWQEKNDALFNNKVKSIADQANVIYQNGISALVSENPEFAAAMNQYKERLTAAGSPEEEKLIMADFETFLKSNPKANDLMSQRDGAVNSAVSFAKSEYMDSKSKFLEKNYAEAQKEFTDKWRLATYKVYKSGLNGDVNMYVSIDRLTHSAEFKKLNYGEKRKAIQDAWKRDKLVLSSYLKDSQEWYPKEGEEYKPFYEWTGRRLKSEELKAQHQKQYNERVGRGAEERYYMYGVDELLNPPDKKVNTYMIKSVAKDEIKKNEIFLSEFKEATGLTPRLSRAGVGGKDIVVYDYDEATGKKIFGAGSPYAKESNPIEAYIIKEFPAFDINKGGFPSEGLVSTLRSQEAWSEVYEHDENDKGWWDDFSSGYGSKVEVPVIGSLFSLSKNITINDAIKNYQNGTSTMSEISLVDAVASLNTLRSLNPPSRSRQVGEMLGSTTSIAMDMLLTGGVFRAGSASAKSLVDDVFTKGVKAAYKADNAVGAYALDVLSNPKNLERVQNVVGTITGSLAQNMALQGNTLEMTLERMKPEMTLSYGGGLNPLITQINNNGEGTLEAYLKSFGVNWANIAIERFAPVLGDGTLKKEALQQLGGSQFLEQMVIGRWFRSQGFKSVDDAASALQKNLGWSNIVDEALVEELLLSKNIEALITGDESLFTYTSDDVITTTLGVGLFGLPMGIVKATQIKVLNNSDNTSIETTAQDGSKIVTPLGKDTWSQFNKLLSIKDLDLQKIVTFFEQNKLPEDQQNALLNVYAKTKGNDLRNDPEYQKAKAAYEDQTDQTIDDSFLDETDVSVFNEKAPEQPEAKSVDEMLREAEQQEEEIGQVESVPEEEVSDSETIPVEQEIMSADSGQNNLDPKELVSEAPNNVDFMDQLKVDEESSIENDIPEIEYEETVLSKSKQTQAKDDQKIEGGVSGAQQEGQTIVEAGTDQETSAGQTDAGGDVQTDGETEVVVLPPVKNGGRNFRRMEKSEGVWKMRDGDRLVDVAESVQQEAQVLYDSEQQYQQERAAKATRTETKTEDAFRQKLEQSLTNFAEGIKIKTDRAYSSILPIPPKLWNAFVDTVKEGLLKGYDIGKAISDARKTVFKSAEVDVDRVAANEAAKMVKDYYSDYIKKSAKPTKQTQSKINKTVGITQQPFIKIRERKILEEKIKSFNKGSKSAIKELQEIKAGVLNYAKQSLSLKDLNGTEVRSLLTQVKNAKDNKTISTALNRINAIASAQESREKSAKVKEIKTKLGSAKTFVKGKGAKKKGKVSIQSVDELSDFLNSEIPDMSTLESMSLEELNYVSDVIDGILKNGRLDVKNAEKIAAVKKSIDNATLINSTYQGKQTVLKAEEDIVEYMTREEKPPVIVNGRYFSSLKEFKDYADTVEEFDGIGLEKKYLDRTRDREKERSAISKIFKGRFINLSNVKNIISLNETLAKYPDARKWMKENVTDPLIKATNSYLNFTADAKRKVIDAQKDIFGSKAKARKELNEIVPGIEKADYGLVTKDHIVAYYCISQQPDRVDNLKKRVDVKALNEFMQKPENKNLLDYANFLMEDFLPSMKEMIGPMYEKLYDMKLPEGKYFPTFASPDSLVGQITLDEIMNPEGMNVTSAMADSLKQRVNYTGDISISEGATRIINDYIDSIYRANLFMPVAEKVNVLLGKQNSPHLMNAIGLNNYTAIARQLSYILTGKEPSAFESNANKLLKGITTFNAITTIGGNLASIPKQFTGVVALFGAGIKDGIYPHDVLMNTGLAFVGKENLDVTKKWLTSDYIIDRYLKGGADKQFKGIMNKTNSIQQLKGHIMNGVKTGILSPVLAGDFLVAATSGSGLMLSYYKKGKAEGMTEDQAFDYAYEKTQTEFNLSQQSSASYATTETQRNRLFQLLAPFRSGQIAYANKLMAASKVLLNKENYTKEEVIQSTHDLFTFTFATYLFSAVASGLVNNLFSDDEEKRDLYLYETAKQSIQGTLQGYGIGGAVIDWTLNSLSDNDWANNIPAIEAMFRIVGAPKKVAGLYEKPWEEMSDSEKKEFYKTVGVNNIIRTADEYEKYVKGEKGLFDAIMRYDPEKMKKSDNDLLLKGWEMIFGTVAPPDQKGSAKMEEEFGEGFEDLDSSSDLDFEGSPDNFD